MKGFGLFLGVSFFFFLLSVFPSPSRAAGYPVGGEWEYEGAVNVSIDGKSALLKDKGKITIDSDYEYSSWRGSYDERVRRFSVTGNYKISSVPPTSKNYNASTAVNRWYNFRYLEVRISGVVYRITVKGRTKGEVEITRSIDGRSVTAVFPATRIRWDRAWKNYYYDGNLLGVEVGCRIVDLQSVVLLLPLFFLRRRR